MGPRHATALFSREYSLRRPHLNQFPFLRTSMQSLFYLNAYSFGPFPFHIIDLVETKLEAPNPSKMEDIYYLWRNVCETVDLLKGAQLLRHMVLFLQSEFFEKPTADKPSLGDFDYKFFLRPFGQLRQVATVIEVEIFLCSMENPLDWELINWILGTKYGSEACEETTSIETASEQQLQRALARDWYNVCLNAGTPGRGWGISPSTLHPVHAAILAAWTSKKPSGKSEFAEKIGYILTNYPEIIEELDPSLSLFTKIRHALTNRRWEALGHVMDCPAACSDFVELDQLAQMIGELMVKYWNNHQGPTQANTGEFEMLFLLANVFDD
ncbi:hypothetical protein BDV12DRAFT_195127 [Aspergillus spectabilis]